MEKLKLVLKNKYFLRAALAAVLALAGSNLPPETIDTLATVLASVIG